MINNMINPTHYRDNGYGIEVIDMMRKVFGDDAVATFCTINAFKYRMRAGKKEGNPAEQDLAKEQWYLGQAKELRLPDTAPSEAAVLPKEKGRHEKRGGAKKTVPLGGARRGAGRPRKQREDYPDGGTADESPAGIVDTQGKVAVRVDKRTTILIPASADKEKAIRKYGEKQEKINKQLKHNNYDSNNANFKH